MSSIVVTDLVKQFADAEPVVKGVSFTVEEGTLTVLLGGSGCGKSTILRMISGLEDVSGGSIKIGGEEVSGTDASKRGVSMVFQNYALFPHLSVAENILFGLKVRKVPTAERNKRLQEAAELVGLSEYLDRKPAQLSGGQRQRVALARTIVARQPVCLMDEPLSNLDAKLRASMRAEIRSLQQRLGLTMIYVTHDQIEAMTMADQVVLLNDGVVAQMASPADLYDDPADTYVARFIGSPPMNVLSEFAGAAEFIGDWQKGWTLGVRAEHVKIATSGLKGKVENVDYLGSETVLWLDTDGQKIACKLQGRTNHQVGDELFYQWDQKDTHWFDENGVGRDSVQAAPPSNRI
ncbi:ATP-binding cassette domain-containing protein [Sneathiella sp. P13V-1]|uniref:ABC transporter ATP-binding protein n=1 Tax=Sneathiella sp. P13V-1 TaxID=2697366 RepID=UPI00187B98B5|nr:ABC transporter ATP-binding protein [Sneathiella sp. P13V-1]MBE7636642.1 ATP-binding cassette domain-containing protein [Sneathiella sp. P13V-1]